MPKSVQKQPESEEAVSPSTGIPAPAPQTEKAPEADPAPEVSPLNEPVHQPSAKELEHTHRLQQKAIEKLRLDELCKTHPEVRRLRDELAKIRKKLSAASPESPGEA